MPIGFFTRKWEKEVGERCSMPYAIRSSYKLEPTLTTAVTLQSAWPVPKSSWQRNQWRGQIKWKNWFGKSECPLKLHTPCWEEEGTGIQARLWKEKKIHKAGKTLRFIDFSLPILWVRKLRGRAVTQWASSTARTSPQLSVQYPFLSIRTRKGIGLGEIRWHEVCQWMRFQDEEAKIC